MALKLDNQSLIGQTQRKTAGNPGAGTYNADYKVAKKKLPSFSMLSRHADAKRFDVPGPGAYNSSAKAKKQAPHFSFGTGSQRAKLQTSVAPGPGIYQIPCTIGNLPSYTGARSKMAYI